MKTCKACGLEKDISSYYKTKKRKDGSQGTRAKCIDCSTTKESKPVDMDLLKHNLTKGRRRKKGIEKEFLGCSLEDLISFDFDWSSYGVTWLLGHVTPLNSVNTQKGLELLLHHSNLSPVPTQPN